MVADPSSRRLRMFPGSRTKKGKAKSLIKKGRWSDEEDKLLLHLVKQQTAGDPDHQISWDDVEVGFKTRSKKQCRERWISQLDPTLKKTEWTQTEDLNLLELSEELHKKWAEIARRIPGRTENMVKNRWHALQRIGNVGSMKRKRKQSKESRSRVKIARAIHAESKENKKTTQSLLEEAKGLVYPLSCISNKGTVKVERTEGLEKMSSTDDRGEFEKLPRDISFDLNRYQSIEQPLSMNLGRQHSLAMSVFGDKPDVIQRHPSFEAIDGPRQTYLAEQLTRGVSGKPTPFEFGGRDKALEKSGSFDSRKFPLFGERQSSFGVSDLSESTIDQLFLDEDLGI